MKIVSTVPLHARKSNENDEAALAMLRNTYGTDYKIVVLGNLFAVSYFRLISLYEINCSLGFSDQMEYRNYKP